MEKKDGYAVTHQLSAVDDGPQKHGNVKRTVIVSAVLGKSSRTFLKKFEILQPMLIPIGAGFA